MMQRPNPVPGRRVITAATRRANVAPRQLQPVTQPTLPAMILDDGVVRRILLNDALVADIPLLAPYASKLKEQTGSKARQVRGCGGCGGGQAAQQAALEQNRTVEYNAIRYHLVHSMTQEQKDKIKAALNVKQLRVYYLDTGGNKSRANV